MKRRVMVRIASVASVLAFTSVALEAQRPPPPLPSLAEEYLAMGRLASAERELYAAVAAKPREPSHRGALALYLASRGEFAVAEVLFREALRFGADTALIGRAMAQMMPYRPPMERSRVPGARESAAPGAHTASEGVERIDGVAVTLPLERSDVPSVIARVAGYGRGRLSVTFDPAREGIAISSVDDPVLAMRAFRGRGAGTPVLLQEITIGERRLRWMDAHVDPSVPAGEVRMGMDLIWRLRPIIDEGAGTLTLPAAGMRAMMSERSFHVPVVLRFPGLWLVPRPFMAPLSLSSPEGRALLRGARWQLNPETATIIVER